MFKSKAKKMQKYVEFQLEMINEQINNSKVSNEPLIAQKVILEETIRYFKKI